MGMTKDLRQYLRQLERQGFEVQPVAGRTSTHCRVLLNGIVIATAGGGHARSINNLKAQVRRAQQEAQP